MYDIIKLMRLHHWIKNTLVFATLFFSGNIFYGLLFQKSILAFFAFGFLASCIYVFNDIQDVATDREHPTKCNRPIAANQVSPKQAKILTLLCITAVIVLNALIEAGPFSWLILLIYFALNIGYSYGLKNIPILDIAILASGFLLRVLYGSVVTNIQVSNWLYLTVMSAAFYMGLGKRRGEKNERNKKNRKVLHAYSHEFLDKNILISQTLIIVFYSLWCIDPSITTHHGKSLCWTIPFVMIILMRYSLRIENHSDGDPTMVLLRDWLLILFSITYGLLLLWLVYG